ncbi:MauE/DoxX family redox-associated membrane protein [Flavihumibacter petaseus]|uniref:Methylamine utilisation protein MauE domain-containing protein n=1 Tax=Flavihumibacter petaseus NBRC 106054 TaxID=1220578 RepID=A0A0E9N5Z6_9BACT|nr:MauE/DoxX family redox-associated membrane protein [Flavihumibacter petaseus]GAO45249.1 hypothetical protein FPE01S_04_04925 [Flavihumibacter petaseus NBRC 106054]
MKKETMYQLISGLFVFLFVYTASSKWMDIETFRWALSGSPLLKHTANWMIYALPAVEILVALLLCIRATRSLGMLSSLALMITFTLYIGYLLASRHELPCSCGGIFRDLTWRNHLIVNCILLVIAALGYRLQGQKTY